MLDKEKGTSTNQLGDMSRSEALSVINFDLMNLGGQLLKSVSRSFYLSMRFLPTWMRPAISIAYLLARATDSVADTSNASLKTKLDFFEAFQETLRSSSEDAQRETCELASGFACDQNLESEKNLLEQLDLCWLAFSQLAPSDKVLITQVLQTITEGQRWDLMYFEGDEQKSVSSEQTRKYTYQVAGCVGEFWTNLGFLHEGEDFSIAPQSQMLTWGIHYGCGLQLVNILRDLAEDKERGRCYIEPHPESIQMWLAEARESLNDGLRYAGALRGWRLRFSSVLPVLLGLSTLDLIEQNGTEAILKEYQSQDRKKLKVSRKDVYGLMAKALGFAIKQPQ